MPFDPSQPFDLVEDQPAVSSSGFDPSKPYEFVDQAPSRDNGDTLRAPSLGERITSRFPSLLSSEEVPLTGMKRGLIPRLHEAFQKSPLDLIPNIPEVPKSDGSIEDTIGKLPLNIAAGAGDFALGTARFLTSPEGLVLGGIGNLGPVAQKLIAAGFAPLLTSQAAQKLGEASVTKDPRAATEGALLAATAGLSAAHATPEAPRSLAELEKIVDETIPKATPEPVEPKGPVKDIFDEVAPEPVSTAPSPEAAVAAQPATTPVESIAQIEPKKGEQNAIEAQPFEEGVRIERQGTDQGGPPNPSGGRYRLRSEAPPQGTEVTEPPIISMGGKAPSDVSEIAPAQLAQLTQSITKLADESKATEPSKAFDLGEAASTVKNATSKALDGLKSAGAYVARKFEGRPVWNNIKQIVGDRHLELTESVSNARKFAEKATKDIPDKTLQEAISNYVDTGGDTELLRHGAEEGPAQYRKGYERAMRLTPEEKTVAENLKNYFESRLSEAQKAGILDDGIENYIHRVYEADSPWKRGVLAEIGSGLSAAKPSLAKNRVFEYDQEAEAAGLKPIKSFVKRVLAYDLALNKAIADRKAIKSLMEVKMPDGRPAIDVAGRGMKTIPASEAEGSATLIDPKWKPTDPDSPKKYRGDYQAVDSPALRKWKWVSADENGNPTFVQGDVLVHPDALKQVKALVGRSALRKSAVGRAVLDTGSMFKQTMLDLSLFHPVQIGIHGAEHRSFLPAPEIDFTNPEVRGLIRGGMVVGDTNGRAMFDEGLAGSSLTKHIPGLGPKLVEFKDYIFQSYIPRLKVSTGLHALERNRKAFPNLSENELYHLTAEQMNHAFGELNYEMMARNKTFQDVLRVLLLAPDFLEARAGFVGQAAQKFGKEQRTALFIGAAVMYVTTRILNKAINGQFHNELSNLFNVVYNGKSYGIRTVQGDIIHAATDFMHFARNRLNPATTRPLLELVTGRDEFGRTRSKPQQLADWFKTMIPISIKGLTEGPEKTLTESILNSIGLTVKRDSADFRIGEKIRDWKAKNKIFDGPGEFVYDPDKDPYRRIKLAARHGDEAMVRSEVQALIQSGVPYGTILKHFAASSQRPLTGSRANDFKFKSSLSEDEKKTFEEAKKERLKIYQTVRAAGK